MRSARAFDVAIALVTLVLLAGSWYAAWRFYRMPPFPQPGGSMPAAVRTIPSPDEIRREARQFRELTDHLGAGNYYRQVNQPSQAVQEFRAALTLDPSNAEALQALRELGTDVPRS